MDKKKAIEIGTLHIWFDDYREDIFNESVSCDFSIWKMTNDDSMDMEDFYSYCRRFALAMGFCEDTVDEWFDI